MALIGVGQVRGVYWFQSDGKMAKWFKDFPITLKNGTDKIRSVVEPGSQRKANKAGFGAKTGRRKGSPADSTAGGGGGVGSLLSGRNRKNSEVRNGAGSQKDGKVWDTLVSGKSRKNSKAEAVLEEMHRPPKSTPPACGYMSRMVRVDKQDKSPNFTTVSGTISSPLDPEVEKPAALSKTESVSLIPRAKFGITKYRIFNFLMRPFLSRNSNIKNQFDRPNFVWVPLQNSMLVL